MKPLSKVTVFTHDGNIVAISDINGKIHKNILNQNQEKFQLVYDNLVLATLDYSDFDKEIITLDDRLKDIEPVIIKNKKAAKYILVKGNFNSYVTVNGRLNCYMDGIVTYVFDNKTKKVKSYDIEQYRIFSLENVENNTKQMGSWDYKNTLDLPKLKDVEHTQDKTNKRLIVKELKGNNKDEIEITGSALQEKEFALFGYRFFDIKGIINRSYYKDSKKTLRDFLEYNEIVFLKMKHKSEADFNQIITYKNFYPTEIDFSDDNAVEKVRLDKNKSQYTTKYWEENSFPNMQKILSSFFKGDLQEKENKK
ncbi:hypothetical protein [Chryseobacterium sp.]|uniref:hypothetical protein n=1 Tax=Chryseobacterium sp. TaxID=1871047 RepID=UPI00388D0B7C